MVHVPRDCSCTDMAQSTSFLMVVTQGTDAAVFLTLRIDVNIRDTRWFQQFLCPSELGENSR